MIFFLIVILLLIIFNFLMHYVFVNKFSFFKLNNFMFFAFFFKKKRKNRLFCFISTYKSFTKSTRTSLSWVISLFNSDWDVLNCKIYKNYIFVNFTSIILLFPFQSYPRI